MEITIVNALFLARGQCTGVSKDPFSPLGYQYINKVHE